VRLAKLLLLAPLLSGCFTMGYLAQAGAGQLHLLTAAKPLSTALRNPKIDPHVKHVLQWVPDMKAFGEWQGLKPTENYVRYTQLDRDAAVYVVQACPPLELKPKLWSFPIVGTVPYLGFFAVKDAKDYAGTLAKEGLDVDVRGASAYSTLGWFKDPVLSTMIGEGDGAVGELANTVLHESTHATLYVKGQSAFDESLASFVGDRLAREWLARRFGEGAKELKAYDADQALWKERVQRLHRAYTELDAVYRSARSDDEKRAQKAELLDALKAELHARRSFNNASLAGYRTYDTGGPAFEKLFDLCERDFPRFLKAVKTLEFPTPQMEDFSPLVEKLAEGGCPETDQPTGAKRK
jgi:predicted aminopeptidase